MSCVQSSHPILGREMQTRLTESMPPPFGARLLPEGVCSAAIEWGQVGNYLSAQGLELSPEFTPRQFEGGLANINILLRIDNMWAVLRRPPEGPIPKGAHDMAREHRVLHGLAPVFSLAPSSLHFCGDPCVAGAPFQILEYREGRLVKGDRLAPLPATSETARSVSVMLIETLIAVQSIDPDAAGLGDLGRPDGFLARTAAGWIQRGEAILEGTLPAAATEVARWLTSTTPREAERPTLLHNDFKLDNLLLHADRIEPVALLDWDMATRGDPLYDLASLLGYWTEPDDPKCMHALRQMPAASPGFLKRSEAIELYARLSGRDMDRFLYPRVLAMFRQAVVFHQLRALGRTNARLADQLAEIDPDELFVFALDIMNGKAV